MRAIILSFFLFLAAWPAHAADSAKESAYARVMRTQTINCGYGTSPPWIYQNLATGKMEGLNVKIMEEVAKQLSFKLAWPEETGWANLPTSLATGKVDVACSLLWIDPARGKQVAYTRPLFYTAIYAYSRADDTRFTGKAEDINRPDVRIAVQDGDVNYELAKRYFPQAKLVALPQAGSWADVYMNVTTGKADITFGDTVAIADFNAHQDKKLKKIPLPQPIVVYGNSLAVGIQETALKDMLDATALYLLDTGKIADMAAQFNQKYPDAILPPKKPY